MGDQRSTATMVDRVEAALWTVAPAAQASSTTRLAVMYAEAIDDDDEGDGLFRFGPRLRTSLEALGLALLARSLLLPPPMSGSRPSYEQQPRTSAVRRPAGGSLAA